MKSILIYTGIKTRTFLQYYIVLLFLLLSSTFSILFQIYHTVSVIYRIHWNIKIEDVDVASPLPKTAKTCRLWGYP